MNEQYILTPLSDYAATGKCHSIIKGHPVVLVHDTGWVVWHHMLYPFYRSYKYHKDELALTSELEVQVEDTLRRIQQSVPAAILLPKRGGKKGWIVVRNGDEDGAKGPNIPIHISESKYTLSPVCIGRILDLKGERPHIQAATMLATGKLKVLDIKPDDTVNLTATERDYAKSHGDKKAIQRYQHKHIGFTLFRSLPMSWIWHQSGAVLFTRNGKNFLMTQDDNAYFAVELPNKLPGRSCHVKTTSDAFELLRPKEAIGLHDLSRQGEWFFIPVPKGKVPELLDCEFFCGEGNCDRGLGRQSAVAIELPIDHRDSNIHTIECTCFRISKGVLYVNDPDMTHTDHECVSEKGWFTFVRNTAVRSVSVKGVD